MELPFRNMKNYLKYILIVIILSGFSLIVVTTIINTKYYKYTIREIYGSKLTQISNSTRNNLPDKWTSCTSDNECFYLPNPCCPGWTVGAFNQSIVNDKPLDTTACQPKPVECISAQPVIPNGKVIKPVCRKNKCEISYIDESMFKPIRMGIPCKKTGDCPGPDALCGKEGFCTVGNK